jgi:hypothetical protein
MQLTAHQQIVRWYQEGRSLSEIAERASQKYRTHTSTRTIYNIVQKARKKLYSRDIEDRRQLMLDEIGKIDRLETEYWDGYMRSISASTETDTEKTTTDDETVLNNRQQRPYPQLTAEVDIDGDEDADDVQYSDKPTEELSTEDLFSGWSRIERADRDSYNRSTGRNKHNKSRRPSRRYEFFEAADSEREELKPPQFSFTRKIVKTCGDPRFLNGVQWCIDRRAKLLGLDAPSKSLNANFNINSMKQMAREMALERGMDPDLVVEDVLRDAELLLQSGNVQGDD